MPLPKNAMIRYVYRCPKCGAEGYTYLGGRVLCCVEMEHQGIQVLVRRSNSRRGWKRPWNVRPDESVQTTDTKPE